MTIERSLALAPWLTDYDELPKYIDVWINMIMRNSPSLCFLQYNADSKVHGANMRPTWLLSAPDGPHVGPMNLAIRVLTECNAPTPEYVFSCDQAALQMVFSVCPSVRPSVCPSVCLSVTPFWLRSHHRIIMKFSGVINNDQSKVYAKGQGQRSKVKVTEVTTQLNRFRTVTPVWIHIWWWNDAYSLMLLRRGALLFFKVIRQISRSHGSKNRRIWPRLVVSGL